MEKEEFTRLFQEFVAKSEDSEFSKTIINKVIEIENLNVAPEVKNDLYALVIETIGRHESLKDFDKNILKLHDAISALGVQMEFLEKLGPFFKLLNDTLQKKADMERKAKDNLGTSEAQKN